MITHPPEDAEGGSFEQALRRTRQTTDRVLSEIYGAPNSAEARVIMSGPPATAPPPAAAPPAAPPRPSELLAPPRPSPALVAGGEIRPPDASPFLTPVAAPALPAADSDAARYEWEERADETGARFFRHVSTGAIAPAPPVTARDSSVKWLHTPRAHAENARQQRMRRLWAEVATPAGPGGVADLGYESPP